MRAVVCVCGGGDRVVVLLGVDRVVVLLGMGQGSCSVGDGAGLLLLSRICLQASGATTNYW